MCNITISKKCTVTGDQYILVIDSKTLKEYEEEDLYIQDALPHLSDDDREFLMNGTTPAEWEKLSPKEDKS